LLLVSLINVIAAPFLLANRSAAAPLNPPDAPTDFIRRLDLPTNVLVYSTTFIGSEPKKLALSDDGHSLYVYLQGAAAIRRFDALTNTPGLQFSTGEDQSLGRYIVNEIAVAPANPGTIAVARHFSNVSPPQ